MEVILATHLAARFAGSYSQRNHAPLPKQGGQATACKFGQ